MIGLDKSS